MAGILTAFDVELGPADAKVRHSVSPTELWMAEWKSTNPTLSASQSSIASMKKFLEDGRLTPLSSLPPPPPPLHPPVQCVHPPTTPIPHGNIGHYNSSKEVTISL